MVALERHDRNESQKGDCYLRETSSQISPLFKIWMVVNIRFVNFFSRKRQGLILLFVELSKRRNLFSGKNFHIPDMVSCNPVVILEPSHVKLNLYFEVPFFQRPINIL